jgi:predicted transposase YdaD
MLSQTDLERERYEARRKAQLDQSTGLRAARLEGEQIGRQQGRQEGEQIGRQQGREEGEQIGRQRGRQEGRQEGALIGQIHLCEQLLGLSLTPMEQLASTSVEELERQADALRERLGPRET